MNIAFGNCFFRFSVSTIKIAMLLCLGLTLGASAQTTHYSLGITYKLTSLPLSTIEAVGAEGIASTYPSVQRGDQVLAINESPVFLLNYLTDDERCHGYRSLLVLRPETGIYFSSEVKADGCLIQLGRLVVIQSVRQVPVVEKVVEGGAGASAGIHPGDLVFKAGGRAVIGDPQKITALLKNIPGDTYFDFSLGRDGHILNARVLLSNSPVDATQSSLPGSSIHAPEILQQAPAGASPQPYINTPEVHLTDALSRVQPDDNEQPNGRSSNSVLPRYNEATSGHPDSNVEEQTTTLASGTDDPPFARPLFLAFLQGAASGMGELAFCGLFHSPQTFFQCHATQRAELGEFVSNNHASAMIVSLLGMFVNPVSWLCCGFAIHARTSGFGAVKLGFFLGVLDSILYSLGDLFSYGWNQLDLTATLMMGLLSGLIVTLVVAGARFKRDRDVGQALRKSTPHFTINSTDLY